MRKAYYKSKEDVLLLEDGFPEDCKRIQEVAKSHGYSISEEDASMAWEEYSDYFFASWLILPEDDEQLWECVKSYFIDDYGMRL